MSRRLRALAGAFGASATLLLALFGGASVASATPLGQACSSSIIDQSNAGNFTVLSSGSGHLDGNMNDNLSNPRHGSVNWSLTEVVTNNTPTSVGPASMRGTLNLTIRWDDRSLGVTKFTSDCIDLAAAMPGFVDGHFHGFATNFPGNLGSYDTPVFLDFDLYTTTHPAQILEGAIVPVSGAGVCDPNWADKLSFGPDTSTVGSHTLTNSQTKNWVDDELDCFAGL
ncbi:MAG: hypothetical protein IT304_04115 [Dehalococcoidia bacterium]|nr:hypothetical protein [Dehalococcoidia bacterium]